MLRNRCLGSRGAPRRLEEGSSCQLAQAAPALADTAVSVPAQRRDSHGINTGLFRFVCEHSLGGCGVGSIAAEEGISLPGLWGGCTWGMLIGQAKFLMKLLHLISQTELSGCCLTGTVG